MVLLVSTTTPTTAPARRTVSVPVFRNTLPNGIVVSTVRVRGVGFETALVAPSGAVSDGVRSSSRGAAMAAHNDVCDGVYGRGYRAEVVLSMLLDLASQEAA